MSQRQRLCVVILTIGLLIIVGMGIRGFFRLLRNPSLDYAQAMESIRTECADVREFERLFPSCTTYISYYNGQAGTPQWNGEIKTGRVEVEATMEVSLDSRRRTAVRCGTMQIHVLQVGSVEQLAQGRERRTYADERIYTLKELQEKLKGISDQKMMLEELSRW